jgi:hypothetical protein
MSRQLSDAVDAIIQLTNCFHVTFLKLGLGLFGACLANHHSLTRPGSTNPALWSSKAASKNVKTPT